MNTSDFTNGVMLDQNTIVGSTLKMLQTDEQNIDKQFLSVNIECGRYIPNWSDTKDNSIYICNKNVDIKSLYATLYKSDFGYKSYDYDFKSWDSINGNIWLSSWIDNGNTLESELTKKCRNTNYSFMGDLQRLKHSIMIITVQNLHCLRNKKSSCFNLKKVGRSHSNTIYTIVDKSENMNNDIGFLIDYKNSQKKIKPPALSIVRDINNKVFCIIIGNYITDRFQCFDKETVYKLFSHYEGKISKTMFDKNIALL